MPSPVEKLEAHARHLLDEFLKVRERYAMLDPMLFDREVVQRNGTGKRAQGFRTLRHSLFLVCVQDIAKYSSDRDDRTPSIRNITKALDGAGVAATLRERYAVWSFPTIDQDDPAILEALRRMEVRDEAGRRAQFDQLLQELRDAWAQLETSADLSALCTVRDKLTAHTEIRFVADKYQPVDIGTLGLKWGTLKIVIAEMQRMVELIGLIVRNTGFTWDMLSGSRIRAGASGDDAGRSALQSAEDGVPTPP